MNENMFEHEVELAGLKNLWRFFFHLHKVCLVIIINLILLYSNTFIGPSLSPRL